MQVHRFSPRISLIEMAPRAGPHSGCPAMPCPVCHQLHREWAVTGRIIQFLSTQTDGRTDTMFAFIYKICKVTLSSSSPLELSVMSPCLLHPVFGPPFTLHIPSFSGICKIKTMNYHSYSVSSRPETILIKKDYYCVHFEKGEHSSTSSFLLTFSLLVTHGWRVDYLKKDTPPFTLPKHLKVFYEY
jgi:hypothetical protein